MRRFLAGAVVLFAGVAVARAQGDGFDPERLALCIATSPASPWTLGGWPS